MFETIKIRQPYSHNNLRFCQTKVINFILFEVKSVLISFSHNLRRVKQVTRDIQTIKISSFKNNGWNCKYTLKWWNPCETNYNLFSIINLRSLIFPFLLSANNKTRVYRILILKMRLLNIYFAGLFIQILIKSAHIAYYIRYIKFIHRLIQTGFSVRKLNEL